MEPTPEEIEFILQWVKYGVRIYREAIESGISHSECMDVEKLKFKTLINQEAQHGKV